MDVAYSFAMDLAFGPDGRLLATAGSDKKARLWQVPSGAAVRTFSGRTDWFRAVAFSPDGRLLATAGNVTVLWACMLVVPALDIPALPGPPRRQARTPRPAAVVGTGGNAAELELIIAGWGRRFARLTAGGP